MIIIYKAVLLNEDDDALAMASDALVSGNIILPFGLLLIAAIFLLLLLLLLLGLLRPASETLFKENVLFIFLNELIVGRAHDGGRTLRLVALLTTLLLILLELG
jgi:hypothetical protein